MPFPFRGQNRSRSHIDPRRTYERAKQVLVGVQAALPLVLLVATPV